MLKSHDLSSFYILNGSHFCKRLAICIMRRVENLCLNYLFYTIDDAWPPQPQFLYGACYQQVFLYILPSLLSEWLFLNKLQSLHFNFKLWLELVFKELNHFGVIADLFRQIGGHSSRFVLFCSFLKTFHYKND